jgi:hypothetical protein
LQALSVALGDAACAADIHIETGFGFQHLHHAVAASGGQELRQARELREGRRQAWGEHGAGRNRHDLAPAALHEAEPDGPVLALRVEACAAAAFTPGHDRWGNFRFQAALCQSCCNQLAFPSQHRL